MPLNKETKSNKKQHQRNIPSPLITFVHLLSLSLFLPIYIYIYIYICVCVCVCVCKLLGRSIHLDNVGKYDDIFDFIYSVVPKESQLNMLLS